MAFPKLAAVALTMSLTACSATTSRPVSTTKSAAPAANAPVAIHMLKVPDTSLPYGYRAVHGNGWTVLSPRSWSEVRVKSPLVAGFASPEQDEAGLSFNIATVPFHGDSTSLVATAVNTAMKRGAKILSKRTIEVGGRQALAVEYMAPRPQRVLRGIGRVVANGDVAVALVCNSAEGRFPTARGTCAAILDSLQLESSGLPVRKAGPWTRLYEGQGWSFATPDSWEDLPHEAPVAVMAMSDGTAEEAIAVTALASQDYQGGPETFADEYLATEQASKTFKVVSRHKLSFGQAKGVDFEFERAQPVAPMQVSQLYLTNGQRGMVVSCGAPESVLKKEPDHL